MQNPNFVFDKKKKNMVCKKILPAKRVFDKKHGKEMSYQTNPYYLI